MILKDTKTSIARRVSALWAIISDKLMYQNSGLPREATKRETVDIKLWHIPGMMYKCVHNTL